MAIVETGKAAVTHYRVLDRYLSHSLIHVWLETGRTHQIRVHMSHLNHVIVGDFEYGYRAKLPKQASDELIYALRNFKRQALHAFRLTIIHPKTKEPQTFEADIPEDMKQLIKILKK
jgi:23S rRNA pseudouridine1911/1915/1917 synthase